MADMSGEILTFVAREGEWHPESSRAHAPVSARRRGWNIRGRARTAVLPGRVHISHGIADADYVFRSDRHLGADLPDRAEFVYTLTGAGELRQWGRHASLAAGGGAFYSGESPAEIVMDSGHSSIAFGVGRAALQISEGELRDIAARRVDGGTCASLPVLVRMAQEVLAMDAAVVSRAEWEALAHASVVLIRGVAESARAFGAGRLPRNLEESNLATRHAVLSYMERHFTDPDVNSQRVATELHISRRRLYRVLEEVGVTPWSYLRDLRLVRADQLLREGHTVDAVARRSGFASAASFRRAFKQKYDAPPSAVMTDRGSVATVRGCDPAVRRCDPA